MGPSEYAIEKHHHNIFSGSGAFTGFCLDIKRQLFSVGRKHGRSCMVESISGSDGRNPGRALVAKCTVQDEKGGPI